MDPKDVGIDDNSIVLTARSGRAALKHRLLVNGIDIDDEKLDKIYEDFLRLADKKKDVTDDDILMLAGADRSAVAEPAAGGVRDSHPLHQPGHTEAFRQPVPIAHHR